MFLSGPSFHGVVIGCESERGSTRELLACDDGIEPQITGMLIVLGDCDGLFLRYLFGVCNNGRSSEIERYVKWDILSWSGHVYVEQVKKQKHRHQLVALLFVDGKEGDKGLLFRGLQFEGVHKRKRRRETKRQRTRLFGAVLP